MMKLRVKIKIANELEESFMGAGLLELLRRIDKVDSIHRAAAEMGLSYAKALKILNRLEENLGGRVLERSRGGRERGGARLTPFGKIFTREYAALQERIIGYGKAHFPLFLRRIEAGRSK
jgi:molybdate transport system regulatory protein